VGREDERTDERNQRHRERADEATAAPRAAHRSRPNQAGGGALWTPSVAGGYSLAVAHGANLRRATTHRTRAHPFPEPRMSPRPAILLGAAAGVALALGLGAAAVEARQAEPTRQAPRFEVDLTWPKPLPNHWIIGSAVGVAVDSRDHVFIIHRGDSTLEQRTESGAAANPPLGVCCSAAPPVLEFDPEGNLVNAWGGPGQGYEWPGSNHGIAVDDQDNVWIGGNGRRDSHILKFSHDGKFLQQIGTPLQPVASRDSTHFGRVAKITFDPPAREAYVADGYGNKRVAVIDMGTGKVKRFWGAYGKAPLDTNMGPYNPDAPPAPQFRNPVHCAEPSTDGLVYVCDRVNDRIQVFRKSGEFVREVRLFPATRGDGSVWDIAFSKDKAQQYVYLADGRNERIYVMDRKSLEVLTMFGDGGRQPGQFFAVHSIATDSKGHIYTTETYEGKRVQRFVAKGMAALPMNQGVPWPRPGGKK
jgi:DNA-binding beta-propeller fold protein YncE